MNTQALPSDASLPGRQQGTENQAEPSAQRHASPPRNTTSHTRRRASLAIGELYPDEETGAHSSSAIRPQRTPRTDLTVDVGSPSGKVLLSPLSPNSRTEHRQRRLSLPTPESPLSQAQTPTSSVRKSPRRFSVLKPVWGPGFITSDAPIFQQSKSLQFVDAEVEKQFRAEYFQNYRGHFRAVFVAELVAMVAFLLSDVFALQELTQIVVRCVCLGLTLLLGIPMFSEQLFQKIWQPLVFSWVFLWALALFVMAAVMQVYDQISALRTGMLLVAALVSTKLLLVTQLGWGAMVVAHIAFTQLYSEDGDTGGMLIGIFLVGFWRAYASEKIERRLFLISETMELEQNKISKLLEAMLPPSAVSRLLAHNVVADAFSDVTVLFAEIDDFLTLSEMFTPQQVVDSLNTVYNGIEELLVDTGIFQVESMGEQALLISGCPNITDEHALVMARFALKLRSRATSYRWPDGRRLRLRMGMHSGSVMASVIGEKRPQYNIIGDSVNTAARMLSKCDPGYIRVSSATQQLLKDHYQLISMGTQLFKGKGNIESFNLLKEKLRDEKTPVDPVSPKQELQTPVLTLPLSARRRGNKIVPVVVVESPTDNRACGSPLGLSPLDSGLSSGHSGNLALCSSALSMSLSRSTTAEVAVAAEMEENEILFQEDSVLYSNRTHLCFRSKGLEKTYIHYSAGHTKSQQRWCYLMAVVLYCVSFPMILFHEHVLNWMLICRGVNIFVLGLGFLMTYSSRCVVFEKPMMIVFGAWVSCYPIFELAFLAGKCGMATSEWLSVLASLLLFFDLNGLSFGASLVEALVMTVALLAGAPLSCDSTQTFEMMKRLQYLIIAMVFSLLAKYSSDRKRRELYVLARRGECNKMLKNDLVDNILPPHASQCLLEGRSLPVRSYDGVTLLFSDIVGFTSISAMLSPYEMRTILHTLYKRFDSLAEEYGVYKVATVGDAYLASAGCPEECDDHAQRVLKLAFGMQEAIKAVQHPRIAKLQMRIGIHTGPVYAGLIGSRAPHFHLFGPACHIAHTLESLAPPSGILVSDATAHLLHASSYAIPPHSTPVCVPHTKLHARTVLPPSYNAQALASLPALASAGSLNVVTTTTTTTTTTSTTTTISNQVSAPDESTRSRVLVKANTDLVVVSPTSAEHQDKPTFG